MMMKSEKTKHLKSLYLGLMSLVLVVMPLAIDKLGYFWQLFLFVSVVLGILSIIFGSSSKFKIGVVLGCISIGLSILFFIAMSFLILSDINALRPSCLCRMQTLSSAIRKYCEQNEGTLPDADVWCDQLLELVDNVENFSIDTFHSIPYIEAGTVKESGYAFNKNLDGYRLSEINRQTVLLFEADFCWNQNGTSAILAFDGHIGYWPFYEGGYHFVFIGPNSTFTVKFIKNSELDSLNWTPGARNDLD